MPCNITERIANVFVDGIDSFSVDRYNGGIRTVAQLDKEQEFFSLGLLLCVRARELNPKTNELGDDFITTSTMTIRINVVDLNDEIPVFSTQNYTTSIYEDVPDGSPVPGVALTVTDRDRPPNNMYNVFLINYEDIFTVSPSSANGSSISILKVMDSSSIDYESFTKVYRLYVVAEEAGRGVRQTPQTATVTINVLDRNDNSPRFTKSYYSAEVMETDPGLEPILTNIQATDDDSGWFGSSGIVYSLLGSGQERFRLVTDPIQGAQIWVSRCATPGFDPCLDYERRRTYVFTLRARDMAGDDRGNEGRAELVIYLTDENDSGPVFTLNSYRGSIEEGRTNTVDDIFVTATDRDQLNDLRYSLEANNQSSYWQINTFTGFISAMVPIFYRFTPSKRGWFDLTVIANDSINVATTNVRIDVIDQNNFAPQFEGLPYTTSILENTTEGIYVFTVRATDEDPEKADNGRVEYNIESGAKGKFVVDIITGDVYTAPRATFDYDLDKDSPYILTILARDGGNPQQTGTATLTVSVLDMNNKLPFFTPRTKFVSVSERELPPFLVTVISATDLDDDHKLEYDLTEPIEALDADGGLVDGSRVDYMAMFSLNRTTGEVRVAGPLDRDLTSRITFTTRVTDVYDPSNPQVGQTGQLQIQILEYNDQSPEFQQAVYNLTVEEEQTIGTFIIALVARDEDDEIDRYEIVDGDRNYFLLTPDTGELNVRRRLDYETLKHVEFTVQAWDAGSPQRSGTAKVYINIANINDNTPLPFEGTYYVAIPEHSPGGTSIVQISATDGDEGDYGEVRYRLPDSVTDFTINSITGVVRLSEGGEFDREKTPVLTTTVIIYDSPLDRSVRRSSSVQVYVSLSDINDNTPSFTPTESISTEVIESIDIGARILQVFATDADEGTNALIRYEKVPGSGDPDDLFEVGSRSGRITVVQSLVKKVGVYLFLVSAKDRDGLPPYRVGYSRVNITVLESLNSPPEWFIPPNDNMTVEVLENQYLGMMVYDVHANDSDSGNNGLVEYYFQVSGREVSRTREFSINKVTGVIRSEVVFDRETEDRYTLHLVAKDRASRPLKAERFFNVRIIDVNDNAPEFPMEDGVVKEVQISVPENVTVNSIIGAVRATDRDLPQYTEIYYHIIAGGKGKFAVDLETGVITLRERVDREEQEVYSLEIRATNGERVDSSATQLLYHDTDPSVVGVTITLQDVNDVRPYFINFNGPRSDVLEYYGFIYTGSAFDQGVVQVSATDDDYDDISRITYDIMSGNEESIFTINRNGLITNLKLLDGFEGRVFTMVVSATDQKWTTTAPVKAFVAGGGDEVKMVINRNQDDIAVIAPQLIRQLESIDGVDYAGVTRVTNHIASSAVSTKSDVYVVGATSVGGGGHRVLSSGELMSLLSADRRDSRVLYDDLGVSAIGGTPGGSPWYDRAPVLAAVILVLLLVLLAIILFLLACCCISELDRMRVKPGDKESSKSDEALLVDKPVFGSGPVVSEEDETNLKTIPTGDVYSTVMKAKSAPSQSVSHDPQPFIEEEEEDEGPVIVTEVDIGEGAGRPASIPPDYDAGEATGVEGGFASGGGGGGGSLDVGDGSGINGGGLIENGGRLAGSGTDGLNNVVNGAGGANVAFRSGGVVKVEGGSGSGSGGDGGEGGVEVKLGGGGGGGGGGHGGGTFEIGGGGGSFANKSREVTIVDGGGFESAVGGSGGQARVIEIIEEGGGNGGTGGGRGDGEVTVVDGGGFANGGGGYGLGGGFKSGSGGGIGEGGGVGDGIGDGGGDNEDDDSVIVATVQGSVMDSPRSGNGDTQIGILELGHEMSGDGNEDDDSVIVATVQESVVDSPRTAVIDVPESPLHTPPPSLNASQDSFSFDLEEATKLYTIKTHDEVDFRSTVLEPVEENSESSSQLNTTNPDPDWTEAFGNPRGSSTLKKPKSPIAEEQGEPNFSGGTVYRSRQSGSVSGTNMSENPESSDLSSVSLARAPGFNTNFGRSLQFGSSLQSRHYDPNSHDYHGSIDLYEADT